MFTKTKNFFPVIYKRTLPASPYYIFIMKYTEQEILDKIKKFYDAYASLKEKSNMQAQTIERLEKEKAELEAKVKDYEARVTSQDSAKKAFDDELERLLSESEILVGED